MDYIYNSAGRLVGTGHASSSALSESFTYNLPGWLTSKASTLFKEQLGYNHSVLGAQPQYGGNISSMRWTVKGDRQRGYAFSYDNLSRLTSSAYMENGARSTHYDTQYSYDLMGNILSLKRNGLQDDGTFGPIDDLTYSYDGNQLRKVDDTVIGRFYKDAMHFVDGADEETEYTFDANGNMTTDRNKGITCITYDANNLADSIAFSNGNAIAYQHTADGKKVRADYYSHLQPNLAITSRSFCDNLVYENDTLRMLLFDGGYVTFAGSDFSHPKYHFYLKDHLGNVRVVADAQGNIEEVNHYYPYGALMGESRNTTTQPYKYNGKELDRMHGLDLYDYGARMYDPTLGMWISMDPMGEKYSNINSYCYTYNNPIAFYDPDGRTGEIVYSKNGVATVYAKFYFYGSKANSRLSHQIATGIASQWNSAKATINYRGDVYKVRFRISYRTVTTKKAAQLIKENNRARNNFARVESGGNKSSFTLTKETSI